MLRLSSGSCMLRLGHRLSIGSCMLGLRLRLSFRGSGGQILFALVNVEWHVEVHGLTFNVNFEVQC